jgi:hypothetical protein
MDFDDQSETTRHSNTLSMGQTLTAPLNNTIDFLVITIIDRIKLIILYDL